MYVLCDMWLIHYFLVFKPPAYDGCIVRISYLWQRVPQKERIGNKSSAIQSGYFVKILITFSMYVGESIQRAKRRFT